MDIAVPALPERYRVYRELGRGAQGVVLHAHDEVLNTDVALKVLRPELAGDEALVERMRREAVLTRRVVHPGICRVHDLVTTASATFLVMDYVDGESFGALLERGGHVAVDEVVRIVAAAADAVSAAHAAGVVHRDLKPHNILVTADGKVVVVDFGVATAADMPKMTTMDAVVGTRAYIAPEIWLGAPATALADIFALGVVLYEALTGTVPYGDVDAAAVTSAVPPSRRKKEVPPWLDDIVLKAMAPMPRDRFQSMKAFAVALAISDDTKPIEPWRAVVDDSRTEPEPLAPKRGAPSIAIGVFAAGALVVGAVAIAAVALSSSSTPPAAIVADAGMRAAHLIPRATTTDTELTHAHGDAAAVVDAGDDLDGAVVASVVNEAKPAAHATTSAGGASLSSKKRAAAAELVHLRAAKNLIARDAPALDAAIADVSRARSERAVDDAIAAGNRAASSVVIDGVFLDRKLTRLNATWAALDGDAKDRVGKALSRASSLIAQRKYDAANVALNDGFALVP